MRHVFVGIPFIGHWLTAGIATFAEACGYQNALERDVRFTFRPLAGSSVISFNVEYMRNCLVGMARADPTVTDLMFIDSDTMPGPDAMNLLTLDADIVAGVYPIPDARFGQVWSVYEAVGEKYRHMPTLPTAPFEAGGAGTGAMIIKRRVLDDPRLHFAPPVAGVPCVFRTPRHPDGSVEYTDDLDFCRRARAAGYRIVVDPRVQFGHVKTRVYTGDGASAPAIEAAS